MELLDLPAELRVQIHRYALIHQENAGFIAPLATGWQRKAGDRNTAWTVVDGTEAHMTSQASSNPTAKPYQKQVILLDDKATHLPQTPFRGHVCEPQCLLQPPLTRVSRQLREETLPIFYGSNNFHLETSTFYGSGGKAAAMQESYRLPAASSTARSIPVNPANPRAWWRSIGDTNLRLIKHLRIVDRPDATKTSEPDADLEYHRQGLPGTAATVTLREGDVPWLRRLDRPDSSQSERAELQECLDQLRGDGPFARGVERALLSAYTLGITEEDWVGEQDMAGRSSGLLGDDEGKVECDGRCGSILT